MCEDELGWARQVNLTPVEDADVWQCVACLWKIQMCGSV